MAETPEEINVHLNIEKSNLPFIGERIDFRGQTYECVSVEWDRRDDEITTRYKNVDKEDPEVDYSALWGGQIRSHYLNNEPDELQKPQVRGAGERDQNIIHITPDHPSNRFSGYNPAGPDRFA